MIRAIQANQCVCVCSVCVEKRLNECDLVRKVEQQTTHTRSRTLLHATKKTTQN